MTIKITKPKPIDPLVQFALDKAHWGVTSRSREINLLEYWSAIRDGRPIPTFYSLDQSGRRPTSQPRVIDEAMLARLLDAPLASEEIADNPELMELARKTQVEPWVIRDLRRRSRRR